MQLNSGLLYTTKQGQSKSNMKISCVNVLETNEHEIYHIFKKLFALGNFYVQDIFYHLFTKIIQYKYSSINSYTILFQ